MITKSRQYCRGLRLFLLYCMQNVQMTIVLHRDDLCNLKFTSFCYSVNEYSNSEESPIIAFPHFQYSIKGLLLLERSQDVNLMQDGQIKKTHKTFIVLHYFIYFFLFKHKGVVCIRTQGKRQLSLQQGKKGTSLFCGCEILKYSHGVKRFCFISFGF